MKRNKINLTTLQQLLQEERNKVSYEHAIQGFKNHLTIQGKSEKTISQYLYLCKEFQMYLADNYSDCISDIYLINEEIMEGYFMHLQHKGLKANTINLKNVALSSLFQYCIKKDYMKSNAMKEIKKIPVKKTIHNELLKEDLQTMLNYCLHKDRVYKYVWLRRYTTLLLLSTLGLRKSELIALKINNLTFTKDGGLLQVIGEKTYESTRTLYIPKKLADVLSIYLMERGNVDNDYLFLSIDNKPLDGKAIEYEIRRLARKVNIPYNVSPHSLRRFAITKLVRDGVPSSIIRSISGHKSSSMLDVYYTSSLEDQKKYLS